MTEPLFVMSHDSFGTRGFPWAYDVVSGLNLVKVCHRRDPEGRRVFEPQGVVRVLLERVKGTRWPDVLGSAWSLMIVSGRVLEDWKRAGIGVFPHEKVEIAEPLPKRLEKVPPPDYYWLDGKRMFGAKMDFEASGFCGMHFCPSCGRQDHDVDATYDRQNDGRTWPMAIVGSSWNGSHVFTVDLSSATFFCTEAVVECARRNKHTNFCFVPAERAASSTEGIKYLR